MIRLNQIDAYKAASEELNKLYQTDQGKKFIHHLIYAYTAKPAKYILFSRSPMFDCLTKSKIYPVSTKNKPVKDPELIQLSKAFTKELTEEELLNTTIQFEDRLTRYVLDHPMPRLAIRSDLTNKFLGMEELQALIDFVNDQIAKSNMTIINMIKYIKTGESPSNKPKKQTPKRIKSETLSNRALGSDSELWDKLQAVKDSMNG